MSQIVSCAAVIRVVTQRSSPTNGVSWGGALRDDPNNGCEGDYVADGKKLSHLTHPTSHQTLHMDKKKEKERTHLGQKKKDTVELRYATTPLIRPHLYYDNSFVARAEAHTFLA